MNSSNRPIYIALSIVGLVFVLLVAAGCWRLGGTDGLLRRVQSEVQAMQPRPDFVPTPLPVAESPVSGVPASAQIVNSERHVSTLSKEINAPQPLTTTAPAVTKAAPTPTPLPILYQPAAPRVRLSGFSHEWQTWNNCGPATLAMNLSYYGSTLTQADIGAVLRSHEDDKNVMPEELVSFARNQGYRARLLVNGDEARLKLLLSNGIPVFIETWLEEEPNDGMGHYRLLIGYDDANQQWLAFDSYVKHNLINPGRDAPYEGITISYAEIARLWPVFNRTYLLVYPEAQATLVESILGADADEVAMWRRALVTAQDEIARNANNPFAWFNAGSSLVALGDYVNAAAYFDHARQIGLPWRMLWYQFGPFEAYYQTGRYQEVVALADATIATTKSVEELYYWKGEAQAALGDTAGARQSWQAALALNPRFAPAQRAIQNQ